MLENISVERGNPLVMGAVVSGSTVNFAITAGLGSNCEVVLYEKESDEEAFRIPFKNAQVIGNVYAMSVSGLDYSRYDYNFSIDGDIITDPYARALSGKENWGEVPRNIKGSIVGGDFSWDGDEPLRIPYDDTILYRLHVRGFTKHASSKVKNKGTYAGIVEKIPYLKDLGVTMVELMPAYEFNEVKDEQPTSMKVEYDLSRPKLNYWGYTDGYLFAPKASFASTTRSGGEVDEFKTMVRELHKNGIEISMEFYFPYGTNPKMIVDCLRFWVMEYHIDGIHVNCEDAVMKMIESDNLLYTTKIFTYTVCDNNDYYNINRSPRNLAKFNDDFMICARKFVKGDEDVSGTMSHMIKANPPGLATVNYAANHNTFTLYDAVSYDRKHNEENGEMNKDGADYNYSWNCGVEGDTRKRTVMDLRKQQMKNLMALVFLSQGVPMIYAGDEMANSQKGNNNPYCIDSEISWTNWNTTAIAKSMHEYVKFLISFRKEHKILHLKNELRQMDYKSYGIPDISYHGMKAWFADFSSFNRHFGVMYCGKYAALEGSENEPDLFVAYNMYWKPQQFGIPEARNKKKWKILFTSNEKMVSKEDTVRKMYMVPGRTVIVMAALQEDS